MYPATEVSRETSASSADRVPRETAHRITYHCASSRIDPCFSPLYSTSSWLAAAMPAPKRRLPARAPARGRSCSLIVSRHSVRCPATRRSAESARDIWSRKSTRSAARWRSRPTRLESSSAFSIPPKVLPFRPRVRKPTQPTRGSQRRRVDGKVKRGQVKAARGRVVE